MNTLGRISAEVEYRMGVGVPGPVRIEAIIRIREDTWIVLWFRHGDTFDEFGTHRVTVSDDRVDLTGGDYFPFDGNIADEQRNAAWKSLISRSHRSGRDGR